MERFRICVTGLRGVPEVAGGIETHCKNLYPRLRRLDPTIDVVVYGRTPYVAKARKRWEGIEIIPLRAARSRHLETLSHTLLSVLRARFFEHADLLHIHAIGPAVFAPLARLLGMTVVVTHHGQDYKRLKWNRFARAVLRLGEFSTMLFAHKVIAVAETNAAVLRKRFPLRARVVEFIPNGAAIANESAKGISIFGELAITSGGYLLAVGRLEPGKGFQDLVVAYKKSGVTLKLVVVGNINHSDSFSKNLLDEASDMVVFAGHRGGPELATLYRNAALFVQPSYHEGLPIVALEAMHADLPIILSNIEPHLALGLPRENYFSVGDCASLAKSLDVGNYDRYRVDGRRILRKYDWDDIAKQTLATFVGLSGNMRLKPGAMVRPNIGE